MMLYFPQPTLNIIEHLLHTNQLRIHVFRCRVLYFSRGKKYSSLLSGMVQSRLGSETHMKPFRIH